MTFVPQSRVLPRVLWRPAIFFFAMAQLVLAFSPLLEKKSPDSRAHIEEAGTAAHHAHNDAECSACTARGLLASSEAARPERPEFSRHDSLLVETAAPSHESAWALHSRSRAPPVLIA